MICISMALAQSGGVFAEVKPAAGEMSSVVDKKTASKDYILLPGDALSITVFQEKDFDAVERVSGESTISIALIGQISVKGKTVRQVEEEVRSLLDRDYLVNPQVHIVVSEYTKRVVNVLGAVNHPGPIEFPQEKGLTLVEAISRAEGFSRVGNMKNVTLTRISADGNKESYVINVQELIDNKNTTEKWPLLPDDIINVKEIAY